MGWSKKRKGRTSRSGGQGASDAKTEKKERNTSHRAYEEIPKENEKLKSYYKAQKILPEAEWDAFWETLQKPLPTTFRMTGSRSVALELRDALENEYVPSLLDVEIDGQKVDPPKPLAWYPDKLGWHVSTSRTVLKKSPEFHNFHQFIVAETEVGNLSRQEAVSMIPPLLLDVQPHQYVLDMCAAPGSKTAQIIEMIHANDKLKEEYSPQLTRLFPQAGLVLANDADYKRSQMLVHQTKRLQSPCFLVTNHDAAHFPNIHVGEKPDVRPYALQFDRVLADVPCSGDGTFRKNELLWRTWGVGSALGLHTTQVKILMRGVQLLKVDGRIVYSTCSFNPIENEAVVAQVLRLCNGEYL
ncbi:S-adenosyl-L-methionine-dependent methyltransferase [Jimgerdemannia flammicorona]|uniref:S-adenosyl-L-methionine-dependent methyltransferase n=1 Tax=Jimgerdemannia flammicorona TaxID=994334 RepID=A0A433PSR2_9FUNG|nr:S-adenosyl-L-methionine-dependent methyltransferase [Jimgerdemannia flammicorona]